MTDVAAAAPAGLARRLACFLYEGVLLFGVVMVAGLVYGGRAESPPSEQPEIVAVVLARRRAVASRRERTRAGGIGLCVRG